MAEVLRSPSCPPRSPRLLPNPSFFSGHQACEHAPPRAGVPATPHRRRGEGVACAVGGNIQRAYLCGVEV